MTYGCDKAVLSAYDAAKDVPTKENSKSAKRSNKLGKVEIRRKIEEILAEKEYRRLFSDPFDDYVAP